MYTLHVQSHPEDRGDFGQGSTNHISEYTFRLELSMYGICCSYIVLANPNMKLRIQFIIMKIIMKIVKICPKSPRFTVLKVLHFFQYFVGTSNILSVQMICLWYGAIYKRQYTDKAKIWAFLHTQSAIYFFQYFVGTSDILSVQNCNDMLMVYI